MKNTIFKYFSVLILTVILISCSTRRDSFVSRNFHALNTKYNVLYNGGLALDKGIITVRDNHRDNFWERLPIERMQINPEDLMPGQSKNADFERAETKAVKAIQKHSMNISGREKNYQIDEAYLMLGKARYYDKRFIPALEAFNYILYKCPASDKINEAKIWREKTNMRLDNDGLAVKNLKKLLKEIKFKDQIYADANATLAQAYLNLGIKDTAIVRLKTATNFTLKNEEKARYRFILAQVYDDLKLQDSAKILYESVIAMKRKSPRQYVIHSHLKLSNYFDYDKGDTLPIVQKFDVLFKDRENRPFHDFMNHQLGIFYDKKGISPKAELYYNKSLKSKSGDTYLRASNYRNLGEMYFNNAKYEKAGKYYDSTLVNLSNKRSKEYKLLAKKKENLADVIKYEGIASKNDSILEIAAMDELGKKTYYEKYIEQLKIEDAKKKAIADKLKEKDGGSSDDGDTGVEGFAQQAKNPMGAMFDSNSENKKSANLFYFYNPKTVEIGKKEFRKVWGSRALKNNWRYAALADMTSDTNANPTEAEGETTKDGKSNTTDAKNKEQVIEKYQPDFYINTLPSDKKVLDSLAKERNFAYFQLGVIYKEKFKEYKRAIVKFEKLRTYNPEERLVLPTLYNLYKSYEITDAEKAEQIKNEILSKYPDSRYAQIISNGINVDLNANETPEKAYERLFKSYESGAYREVYEVLDKTISGYIGDEIVPKFELLSATLTGKLKGVAAYKKALNEVALSYPNSVEGKQAEELFNKDIPELEKFEIIIEPSKKWKMLYLVSYKDTINNRILKEKLLKMIAARPFDKLSLTEDIYTINENLIVIHGVNSEEHAKNIATVLKEYKEFKINQLSILVSNYNYKVIQMKKNLTLYLNPLLPPNAFFQTLVAVPQNTVDNSIEPTEELTPEEELKRNKEKYEREEKLLQEKLDKEEMELLKKLDLEKQKQEQQESDNQQQELNNENNGIQMPPPRP